MFDDAVMVGEVDRVVHAVDRPLNQGDFAADHRVQRQYHQVVSRESEPQAKLRSYERRNRSCSPSNKSPRRSQDPIPKSTSPSRHSATLSSHKRPNSGAEPLNSYHLMELDADRERLPTRSKGTSGQSTPSRSLGTPNTTARHSDWEERYEARVALVIQFAILFFCAMIVLAICLAIVTAVLSNHVYWVIIALCLTFLVTLVLGLGCFLYQVLQEDDAPSVNQKHMPKWYRTLRKIVRDEISDFREDWLAMCNNMYLLEDGAEGPLSRGGNDLESMSSYPCATSNNASNKPKKRLGKSTLFKLVAKPAALLASFRRKRKDKRREKKLQAADESLTSFPPTLV
jgi:hypothetical protein